MIHRILAAMGALFVICSAARADQVTVAGNQVTINRTDCQALATYRPAQGAQSPDYQPGVDVHGHHVAPADASGGFTYTLPETVEFDVQVNPINYAQRTTIQRQIASVQAKLAQNPSDAASQRQLASLQGQLAAITGTYDNTAMSVGHVVVNTRTGDATMNGKPLQNADQQYLIDLCRKAGY
jgi:hypothetical protein